MNKVIESLNTRVSNLREKEHTHQTFALLGLFGGMLTTGAAVAFGLEGHETALTSIASGSAVLNLGILAINLNILNSLSNEAAVLGGAIASHELQTETTNLSAV